MKLTEEECPFKAGYGFCDNKQNRVEKCEYLKSKGKNFRDCPFYKRKK